MGTILLGIGEYGGSQTPGDIVKTLALGSCVALIFLDPLRRAVGMTHIALPDSQIAPERSRQLPGYFADTGIPALLAEMTRLGCDNRGRGLIVKLAGGAQVMDANERFSIGKRNVLAIKKILWGYGLGPLTEDIGGNISRSVAVDVNEGRVIITGADRRHWEI